MSQQQVSSISHSSASDTVADISSRSNLRSAQRGDMVVPQTRTQLRRRSFHVAAPVVWNVLPVYLRSTSISRGQFRAGLKTNLFNQAYNILWEYFVLRVYCTYWLNTFIQLPINLILSSGFWHYLFKVRNSICVFSNLNIISHPHPS